MLWTIIKRINKKNYQKYYWSSRAPEVVTRVTTSPRPRSDGQGPVKYLASHLVSVLSTLVIISARISNSLVMPFFCNDIVIHYILGSDRSTHTMRCSISSLMVVPFFCNDIVIHYPRKWSFYTYDEVVDF